MQQLKDPGGLQANPTDTPKIHAPRKKKLRQNVDQNVEGQQSNGDGWFVLQFTQVAEAGGDEDVDEVGVVVPAAITLLGPWPAPALVVRRGVHRIS